MDISRFTQFPLYKIIDGQCSCPVHECPDVGKHPAITGWRHLAPAEKRVGPAGCGYGVATGAVSDVFVIDTDVKNGIDGEANYQALGDLPTTYTVRTPSGGKHRYYRWPGFTVRNSRAVLAPGVDVRGDGGFVVAPGSLHANGGVYTVEVMAEIATAPSWLLKHPGLRAPERLVTTSEIARGPEHRDWAYRLRMGRQEAAEAKCSIQGKGGSQDLWHLAQVLVRNWELPTDTAEDLILEEFNPRCEPEWSVGEIRYKLNQAATVGGYQVGMPPEGLLEAMNKVSAMTERFAVTEETHGPRTALTEDGNAELYVSLNAGQLMNMHGLGWFAWEDGAWVEDKDGGKALGGSRKVHQHLLEHANQGDSDEVKKRTAWAFKSQSLQVMKNTVTLAKGLYKLDSTMLDSDPLVLNVTNGVVDLKTGGLLPHSPDRLITKMAGTSFDAKAKCPRWEKFLARIFNGDKALVAYMQRYVGYCLTGSTEEQQLTFLYGSGSNGKSTFTVMLQALMGNYACASPSSLLLAHTTEQHPTAIADLRGIRFTVCQETEQGRSWDESLLKQLTGGDKIRARKMRMDFFEFNPSHKICTSGNYKPNVKGIDNGIWRRICLVPFDATIEGEEKDKKLVQKLEAELPGILNWAIEGCLEWQRQGLGECEAVTAGTKAYREEEDALGRFLSTMTHANPEGEVFKKDFYDAYDLWARQEKEEPMTNKVLKAKMLAKGYGERKSGPRIWTGVQMKTQPFGKAN